FAVYLSYHVVLSEDRPVWRSDCRSGWLKSAVLTLTAGFLLSVLWFDLMFDVQVLGGGPVGEPLAEPVLASIAAYYRHVTTSARPMSYLVGLVMLVTMGGTLIQVFVYRGHVAIRLAALALCEVPIVTAHARN